MTNNIETEDWLGWFDWNSFPESVRLIRYDARGHGVSDPCSEPEAYRWTRLADDMLALADGLGIDRFVAGGASMGASTAIYAAMKQPDRVGGLVLVIPPTAWETREAQADGYRASARLAAEVGSAALADMVRAQAHEFLAPWMLTDAPQMIEGAARGLLAQTTESLEALYLGAGMSNLPDPTEFDLIAHIPTLILPLTDDPGHPVSTAERLHDLLPNSELVVEEGLAGLQAFPRRIRDFVVAHT